MPVQPVDLKPGQAVNLQFEPVDDQDVGVPPVVSDLRELRGCWPDGESVDDFVQTVRRWRDQEDAPRTVP